MPRTKLGLSLLAGIAVLLAIPVPYVRLAPGPVYNTIGKVNGHPVISIQGTQTYATSGDLDMTTVTEYGGPGRGLNAFEALWAWFSPDQKVVPREAIFPEGQTAAEARAQAAEMFSSSQSYAIGAALGYLKLPVTAEPVVSTVAMEAPALGHLRAGDVIKQVDGKTVATPTEVVQAVRSKPIGSTLRFAVMRDGSAAEVNVTSAAKPDNKAIPYIGITVDSLYRGDFDVQFGLEDIGGPSAGTMFALGLIDLLTPGSLTQGRHIAGTGTIDPHGEVGVIGGIAQKMRGAKAAGAELFIAPKGNCADVLKGQPDGLQVVPVETLSQAKQAIDDFIAGKTLPICEIK